MAAIKSAEDAAAAEDEMRRCHALEMSAAEQRWAAEQEALKDALRSAYCEEAVEALVEQVRAEGLDLRIAAAREHRDRIAAREELLDDHPAQKSAAASNQRLHAWFPAHSARSSRRILALWRTSTGKPAWKRNR